MKRGTDPSTRKRAFIVNREDDGGFLEYTNLTIGQRVLRWKEMVREYGADGVLFHDNRSCHTFSRLQGQIASSLQEEPSDSFHAIVFEGDMGLADRFQKHRFETAIETYF